MLPEARFSRPALRPRAVVSLALAALAACALPTVYVTRLPAAPANAAGENEAPDATVPVKTADNAPAQGKPVRVELPGGGIMEFIGIGEHPSKDRPWWAADGGVIAAPYETFRGSVHSDDHIVREFAMRWIERPAEGSTVGWSIKKGGSSAGGASPLDGDGRQVADLEVHATALPPETKMCTIAISAAHEAWKTQAQTDGQNASAMGTVKYTFAFTPAFEAQGKLVLTVSHNDLDQDIRVVAVDRNGKTIAKGHLQGVGGHGFLQTTATFSGLALKDVAQFEIQTRPYERFEIRDVSLAPGERSLPRVVKLDAEQTQRDRTAEALRQRLELLDKVDVPPNVF